MIVKQTLVKLIILSRVENKLICDSHVPPTQQVFYPFLATKSIKMHTISLGKWFNNK